MANRQDYVAAALAVLEAPLSTQAAVERAMGQFGPEMGATELQRARTAYAASMTRLGATAIPGPSLT